MIPCLSDFRQEQRQVVDTLDAAYRSGRLHHAYLLVATDVSVASRLAMAFAARLVCREASAESPLGGETSLPPEPADPCRHCPSCRQLAAGSHPDAVQLEANDKGLIVVDAVRALVGRLVLTPTLSTTKVALLPGADRMNPQAQNALLKTLEEPPGATCFVLTTHRPRALLPTIRSRCQRLNLRPPHRAGLWQALVEGGHDAPVAQVVSALAGADSERAQQLADAGAAGILERLQGLVAGTGGAPDVLSAAAELGSDKQRYDLTLAFLEVALRDRLAALRRATTEQLCAPDVRLLSALPADRACLVADRISRARRLSVFNPNRVMVLESILAALTGSGQAGSGGGPPASSPFASGRPVRRIAP